MSVNPFEMHVLETKITACYALHFEIPNPYEPNTVIHACVELNPQPTQVYAELWGPLPFPGLALPEHRAKYASGCIPFSNNQTHSFHEFMDIMVKLVTESDFFKNGIQTMLQLIIRDSE